MTDTQLERQPAPAAEAEPGPEPTVAAQGAPLADAVTEAEPPTAPARRLRRAAQPPIELPVLALPGVSSADIRAELARRERRVAKLLAERERVIAAMNEIEAALDSISQ